MTPTSTTTPASTTTSTATPSCTTAVPGKYGYVDPSACNAYYAFSPSFTAAIAFSVLFGIVTIIQITEAFLFKKRFCWVMIMGCLWEFGSFITRAMGSHNQQSMALALVNQLLLLLAPLCELSFPFCSGTISNNVNFRDQRIRIYDSRTNDLDLPAREEDLDLQSRFHRQILRAA